jgi:hypothetical protein
MAPYGLWVDFCLFHFAIVANGKSIIWSSIKQGENKTEEFGYKVQSTWW